MQLYAVHHMIVRLQLNFYITNFTLNYLNEP